MQRINLYTKEFKTRKPTWARLTRLIAASLLALLITVLIWALAPIVDAHGGGAWRAPASQLPR